VTSSSALRWITRHGPFGLGSLLALGAVGVPLPDEILLTFAGSQIADGRLPLLGTLLAATVGAAVGITVTYAAGRVAGRRTLEAGRRRGLIPARAVASTNSWFQRSGRWSLLLGCFVPGVRHVVALLAGSVNLPFLQFAAFAWTGALLWCTTFVAVGIALGREWHTVAPVLHRHLVILGIGVAAVLSTVLIARVARRRRRQHQLPR
jgi:membrane protein DedA with SNARE-associated domain